VDAGCQGGRETAHASRTARPGPSLTLGMTKRVLPIYRGSRCKVHLFEERVELVD